MAAVRAASTARQAMNVAPPSRAGEPYGQSAASAPYSVKLGQESSCMSRMWSATHSAAS